MKPMLTAKDVGKLLKVAPRVVSERYAYMPGFPKALRLPSPKGQGVRRWKAEDIETWIHTQIRSAAHG